MATQVNPLIAPFYGRFQYIFILTCLLLFWFIPTSWIREDSENAQADVVYLVLDCQSVKVALSLGLALAVSIFATIVSFIWIFTCCGCCFFCSIPIIAITSTIATVILFFMLVIMPIVMFTPTLMFIFFTKVLVAAFTVSASSALIFILIYFWYNDFSLSKVKDLLFNRIFQGFEIGALILLLLIGAGIWYNTTMKSTITDSFPGYKVEEHIVHDDDVILKMYLLRNVKFLENENDISSQLNSELRVCESINSSWCVYPSLESQWKNITPIKNGEYHLPTFHELRWPLGCKHDRKASEEPVVVYLQHGILNSGLIWFVNGMNSLPFVLADKGYHVWIGANRGTRFSKVRDKSRTSWHEMGTIDLPLQIRHALKVSKASRLTYIGHSQGTTQLFVGLTEVPYLSDAISLFIGLDPVITVKHPQGWLIKWYSCLMSPKSIQQSIDFLFGEDLSSEFKRARQIVFPIFSLIHPFMPQFLVRKILLCNHCQSQDLIKFIQQGEPSSTTKTNILHWLQSLINHSFSPLGSSKSYDMSKIPLGKVQFVMYFGSEFLSRMEDMEYLDEFLHHSRHEFRLVHMPTYLHNDFVLGETFEELYPMILEDISRYNNYSSKSLTR